MIVEREEKMDTLKYKVFFVVKPERIVELCRQEARESKSSYALALKTLGALGVPSIKQRQDILSGDADVVTDDDGWMCYIDHRVTKEVMNRITGKDKKNE
jgi:hypothetical protein